MSIDTGLRITYKENYPIPGIEQSTQQFRDNFTVTRYAIENIHAMSEAADSILSVRMDVSEANGAVKLSLGYLEDIQTPQEGMLRFEDGSIEWYAFGRWVRPLTDGPNMTAIIQDTVGEMVTGTTPLGIIPEYDDDTRKLKLRLRDFTLHLSGDVTGSATVSNLDEMNIVTDLSPSAVKDIVGDLVSGVTHSGMEIIYEQDAGKLVVNAKDFQIALTGEVTGSATVAGLSNTSIDVRIDRETIQDIVGAMVSGNTESGIQVTYDDPNGKLNFTVLDTIVPKRSLKADVLSNKRKINLVGNVTGEAEFDGSQDVTINTTVAANIPGFSQVGDIQVTGGYGFTETYTPGSVHNGADIGLFSGQWRCQGSFKVNATDSATLWMRVS